MKRFFQVWSTWWFATMVPVYTPLTTLAARESVRKRRLQSIVLLLAFMITSMIIVLYSFNTLILLALFCCAEDCFLLFALWLNRRGYMESGCVVFFASEILLILLTTHTTSLSDPYLLLWTFSPMGLLLACAGIFLPPWIILLIALGENIVLFWYLLVVSHNQLLHVPSQDLKSMLTFLGVSIYVNAGIGAFYAILTQKAVIQADRAVELEQAHQSLTDAYTRLEKVHSDLESAHSIIQQQALTDGLTGLPNHRAVVEQLEKEMDRARRYDHPFSLLFFDADRFKRINDTYGHEVGDKVLRCIAERVGGILRHGDTLGRFGGEEFVLLLPEADINEAGMVAERVRAIVANEPIMLEDRNALNTTVSIGVATYPTDGHGEQELLQQADQAMYLAKRLGRNQVRTAIEAVRMSADIELMEILQSQGQNELKEREALAPEHIREKYTVKIICSLMSLLERRDQSLCQHAYAVSDLATSMAQVLGLEISEVSRIGMAALLHDIGKIAIPDVLLQKASELENYERELLKEHPELGAQILESSPFLHDLIPAVQHHHERWDGSGYPAQLAQENIPLAARIIGVAEAYDAMIRDRPYQTTRTPEDALMELWYCAGTQFDPTMVQVLSIVLADMSGQQPEKALALVP